MTHWKLVPEGFTEAVDAAKEFYGLYTRTVVSGCTPMEQLRFVAALKFFESMLAAAPQQDVQPVAKVHVHKTGGNAGVQWSAVAVNGYDSLPLLEDGTLLYLAPPAADVQPVAYETENELWWHDAPDINDHIRKTGIPLYRHPPAADVQELVEALQDIMNNCLSSNGLAEAHTKARAALAKWEGK